MFDLVNKAKKFLSQTPDDDSDQFKLSQDEVDRILKEEIYDKFEALEKQAAIEQAAITKEEERNQLATKLKEEALLRRQVLQDANSTPQQIHNSLQTLSSNSNTDPQIVELQNLLNTLVEVRANTSNTDEEMAKFLANCNLGVEEKIKLSIEEQMNSIEENSITSVVNPVTNNVSIEDRINNMGIESSLPTISPPIKRPSIEDAMNSLFQNTIQYVDNSKPELSEIDLLKKSMGF